MAERELTAADWRAYGAQQFPSAVWSVDEKVLHAVATAVPGDLITRESFSCRAPAVPRCSAGCAKTQVPPRTPARRCSCSTTSTIPKAPTP